MINIDKWGKLKLAYQIKKFEVAYYVFFLYKGEADIPSELERRFKQNEAVIRYLTVKKEEGEEETTPPKKATPKAKEKAETKPEPEVELKPEKKKKTSKEKSKKEEEK
jgi:small subunit ribosomal protein S6